MREDIHTDRSRPAIDPWPSAAKPRSLVGLMGISLLVGVLALTILSCRGTKQNQVIPLSAPQAQSLLRDNRGNHNFIILDIRTPAEYAQGHIQGATLLDYYRSDFKERLNRLDRSKVYFIYCRSGNRSGRTMKLVADLEFEKIYHLKNGIVDWYQNKLPLTRP